MLSYYDLGTHTSPIATSSPDAQRWFDRGLIWNYGFNHEEAIRCYEAALAADPDCAMAYWGIAYSAGPNYNRAWHQIDEQSLAAMLLKTVDAVEQATRLSDKAGPADRALIGAIAARYQSTTPADDLQVWSDDYADAMRAVYRDFGDNLDVAALFAEALMNRTPWHLWDLNARGPAEGASTLEAKEVLERALRNPASRTHPGVLHMYVHLMEMSPFPEQALTVADRLRELVPDAGHLRHMSTHIDVLCGHYQTVVDCNQAAIVADQKFVEREGAMNVYTLYRTHNVHFKLYGAMFLGQSEIALEAADEMTATIPLELLQVPVPPMADRLEGRFSIKPHALIRFGKWQEIIDMPLPEDQQLFSVTTAMLHYAKGVAYSATGQIAEAEQQQALFEAAIGRVPETRFFQNNTCLDILTVAEAMLAGELEYRKGNYEAAFAHLRESIDRSDSLVYAEPWAWMQPPRHAYGALLLEQGHVEDAEAVYRADLGLDDTLPRAHQHPENVWSLHGYHECLQRLGKHELAGMMKQRLDLAVARADVPIQASCYCRTTCCAA